MIVGKELKEVALISLHVVHRASSHIDLLLLLRGFRVTWDIIMSISLGIGWEYDPSGEKDLVAQTHCDKSSSERRVSERAPNL